MTNLSFDETYTYAGLNQLATFNKTGTAKSWDYDAPGNWDGVTTNAVTESRTQNRQNEFLTATGQTSPTYDNNGNQTRDFANLAYTYDAWNRPRTASSRTYEYDALGRRARRIVSATTTAYFYDDQWRMIEDRTNGTPDTQYVWSAGYVDEMVLRDRDADGNGSLEERLYAAQDANYNVTPLFSTTGAVQERYAYDPYGTRSIYGAAWGSGRQRGHSTFSLRVRSVRSTGVEGGPATWDCRGNGLQGTLAMQEGPPGQRLAAQLAENGLQGA